MHPFKDKYNYKTGTHCWYCDREYEKDRILYNGFGVLKITKEHIIPKSKLPNNIPNNYISSCTDCNYIKNNKNAKQFALFIDMLIKRTKAGEHSMYKYFKIMRERAWKIYNKTSVNHKKYTKSKC